MLGKLKEGKSVHMVECAELHAICSIDNKIANVHKLVVKGIKMKLVHTCIKIIRPYDERINMFQGVLALLVGCTPDPNHFST